MANDETVIVVAVLDSTTVVINLSGMDLYASLGQRVAIFTWGPEIRHPTTKKSLGHLEILKGYGKIISVQENMSIVTSEGSAALGQVGFTANELSQFGGGALSALATSFGAPSSSRTVEVGDLVKFV
jgi:hypothetical protein